MLFNNSLKVTTSWQDSTLPCFYSALNSIDLASKGRLIMLVWACGPIEHFPNDEMLLGQVNIKCNALVQSGEEYFLDTTERISLANMDMGEARVKIKYRHTD